jgi:hypothetical protein
MQKPTLDVILDKAGGDLAVAFHLKVHQFTVTRWRTTGIPAKRWRELMDLYQSTCGGRLTLDDLMAANERTKQSA